MVYLYNTDRDTDCNLQNSYTPVQTICDGVSEYFTQGCLTQPSEIDLSIIQSALDLAKSCLLARPDEVRAASAKQVNGHSNVTRNETVETMDIDDSEARMYGEYTLFAALMTLQNPRRNSRQLHRLYVKDYTDESQRWKVYYSDGHGEQSITVSCCYGNFFHVVRISNGHIFAPSDRRRSSNPRYPWPINHHFAS